MTAPELDVWRRWQLRTAAINAVRAMGCECGRNNINVSDEYAKGEPCDSCSALAFLQPDFSPILRPVHRPF